MATPIHVLENDVPDGDNGVVAASKSKHPGLSPVAAVNRQPLVANDLFKNLPKELEVGRYHSWIVSDDEFPEELEVTARDDNKYIMGLRHKHYDVQGVQFHPESVLTPMGEQILRNWLSS